MKVELVEIMNKINDAHPEKGTFLSTRCSNYLFSSKPTKYIYIYLFIFWVSNLLNLESWVVLFFCWLGSLDLKELSVSEIVLVPAKGAVL